MILTKSPVNNKLNDRHCRSVHQSTGCSLNIVFFSQNVLLFLNSASSAAALVFYLPGVCIHTDTEGKQRKVRVRNIFKKFEKNTIYNEHPVYFYILNCNAIQCKNLST